MTENNIAQIINNFIPIPPLLTTTLMENIGKKFGKLIILEVAGRHPDRRTVMVKCRCDCGNLVAPALSDIKRLHTTSCGCITIMGRRKHGEAASKKRKATPEYCAWLAMRCKVHRLIKQFNSVCRDGYAPYSLKNFICERWLDKSNGYTNFLQDMGKKPSLIKSALRRRDNEKRYDKDNCYWRASK
jgi:hypothetical protein